MPGTRVPRSPPAFSREPLDRALDASNATGVPERSQLFRPWNRPHLADRIGVRSALLKRKRALRRRESALIRSHSPSSQVAQCGACGLARGAGLFRVGRELLDFRTLEVAGRNSGAAHSRFTSGIPGRAAKGWLSPSIVSGGSPRIPDVKCAAGLAFVVTHPSHPPASPPRGFPHGVGSGHLPLSRLRTLFSLHRKPIVADGCDRRRSGRRQAVVAGREPAAAENSVSGRQEFIGGTLREPKIVARAMRKHPRAVADTLRRWRQ